MLTALELVVNAKAIILIFFGNLLGTIVGAIPGLTATMTIAVLTPITFNFKPIEGILMLVGIYIGGIYGGSMSAILLNIPGTPSSLMTALDGYPLTKKGEPGRAIGIATLASGLGGLLSILVLITIAPIIAKYALKFGAAEYFALCAFGLSMVASLSQASLIKGLIAAAFGIWVTTIGMDPMIGVPRFTYGFTSLLSGLSYIPMMIGLFGVREVLTQISSEEFEIKQKIIKIGRVIPTFDDVKKLWKVILRGAGLGIFVGALPGAGGSIGAIIGYNNARQTSKNPESFGKGNIEGIAAPESANNASIGGAFIPLLTLGVPGDAITAILIGAFMIHNLRPGPLLYRNRPEIILSIYIGLLIAHIFLFLIGFYGSRYYANIVTVKKSLVMPVVLFVCMIGSFAYANRLFDILLMLIFGLLGFLMEKNGYPIAPMVLGIVLGPIMEMNFRTAIQLADGNILVLFTRPISLILWILLIISLTLPMIKKNIFNK